MEQDENGKRDGKDEVEQKEEACRDEIFLRIANGCR